MHRTTLRVLKRGILLFWALYFTIVLASNLADALQALGALPDSFPFVSGNYGFIARVTGIYGTPAIVNAVLYLGVLVWEAVAAALFWQALRRWGSASGLEAVDRAFTVSAGLWAAFVLMDELFIAYEIPGLEATHVRLFVASLVSLLAVHLLPDEG